jgi:repressor of nif and glnA expression
MNDLQAAILEVFRAAAGALASGAAVLGRDTVVMTLRGSGINAGTLAVLDALLLLESQELIKVVGVGLYELTEQGKGVVCK